MNDSVGKCNRCHGNAGANVGGSNPNFNTGVETSPEDLRGMIAAEGILTARGGVSSHAGA